MTPTYLNSDIAVGAQIEPQDIPGLAALGFTDIVCNRPDAEHPGGPVADKIAAAAARAGLRFHYLPVTHGTFPVNEARDFAAIRLSPGARVFAYCRSGARSTALWELSKTLEADLRDCAC